MKGSCTFAFVWDYGVPGLLGEVLESAPTGGLHCLLGEFNAHVGNNSGTWRAVNGSNGLSDLSGILLFDFCARHILSMTNTMLEHKSVHQYKWHQDTLGRRSMTVFAVVSGGLRPCVLDTGVHLGAELATDPYRVSLIHWLGRTLVL